MSDPRYTTSPAGGSKELQVERYRLLGIIGQGGMGVVYEAIQEELKQRVAIKFMIPELCSQARYRERFFREARVGSQVRHPGLVQIFGFGQHESGQLYILMEYLEGEPLRKRLQRRDADGRPPAWPAVVVTELDDDGAAPSSCRPDPPPAAAGPPAMVEAQSSGGLGAALPLMAALRFAQQVASAMSAAHAAGVVHRDLKPDNLFVISDPQVAGGERIKILDFGIARLVGFPDMPMLNTEGLMGTPTYMAPERCQDKLAGDRSDVYSLGCTLYEMCTGRPPFLDEPAVVMRKHVCADPLPPRQLCPDLPAAVNALILRMLDKDPDARPSMQQASEQLASLLDKGPHRRRSLAMSDPWSMVPKAVAD